MPLLFLGLSVLAVLAMGTAKAVSTTPPLSGGQPVTMKPGEIWAVAGTRSDSPTDAMWAAFRDKLVTIMASMGARVGKMTYSGSSFAFQVQPVTVDVHIQVPMVDAQFSITKVEKLSNAAVSGLIAAIGRGGGGGHGHGGHHGGHHRGRGGFRGGYGYPFFYDDCLWTEEGECLPPFRIVDTTRLTASRRG